MPALHSNLASSSTLRDESGWQAVQALCLIAPKFRVLLSSPGESSNLLPFQAGILVNEFAREGPQELCFTARQGSLNLQNACLLSLASAKPSGLTAAASYPALVLPP